MSISANLVRLLCGGPFCGKRMSVPGVRPGGYEDIGYGSFGYWAFG